MLSTWFQITWFQIKNCSNPGCVIYCCLQIVRLPMEPLIICSFLPDPLLDNSKEHYKDFHESYGKETTENDHPSLKFPLLSTETDKVNKELLFSHRFRSAIKCANCLQPRCIYAASKLDHKAFILLRRV